MGIRQCLIIGGITLGLAGTAYAQVNVHILENDTLRMELTPDIGGRVLSFHLKDHENFLLVSDEVKRQPKPEVNAEANNIAYFGHETWVGPQSAWWTTQSVNEARRAAKAVWPPDPYLILAANEVVEASPTHMIMQTPESPVSGVQLRKSFQLDEENNKVKLQVEGKNIRTENVSWDIWFNTRVPQDTQVYVPVGFSSDVRVDNIAAADAAPLEYALEDGVLILGLEPPPEGKKSRLGKIFIQPSEGWMAGFRAGQAFIIRFPLQPLKNIHPEQGHVEIYHKYHPDSPAEGVLEMEVHSMYRTLTAGETMTATEEWILLPYTGPDTHNARVAFLRQYFEDVNRIQ